MDKYFLRSISYCEKRILRPPSKRITHFIQQDSAAILCFYPSFQKLKKIIAKWLTINIIYRTAWVLRYIDETFLISSMNACWASFHYQTNIKNITFDHTNSNGFLMASKIQLELLFSNILKKVEYIHTYNIYGKFFWLQL